MDRMNSNDKVKKTRNRVPISCEHCRKRKQKCDRQKPCGNCTKGGLADTCKYAAVQQGNSIPKVNLNNELIKLKLKISKLERIIQMHNIDLSHYKDIMPELENDDIEEEEDPMVSLSEKFDSMMIKENRVMHSGTTSYITYVVQDKKLATIFSEIHQSHEQVYEGYKKKLREKASDYNFKFDDDHAKWLATTSNSDLIKWNTPDVEIFCGVNTPTGILLMQTKSLLSTINEVNKILPSIAVVNALIDHFFEYVYPFIPLIDEEIFREDLECVLIANPDGSASVSIAHIQHSATISLFLLVLRYAYLAINIDAPEEHIPVLKQFIQSGSEIGTCYPVLAKRILMSLPCEDAIFKKITLKNIQVLLFLRLYQIYSPEMHEENRENSLTLTIIIQMCRSFGSNRDLAKFPNVFADSREINLWRRLFFKLLWLDAQNAFEYGCPLIISDDEYDVVLPKLEESDMEVLRSIKKGIPVSKSSEEVKKIVTENSINKDIALEYELTLLIREGLNEFQNFKKKTKRSTLLQTLKKIQTFVDTKIPSMWELVQPYKNEGSINQLEKYCGITRTRSFETKVSALNFLMGFYYLLFLNDEESSENGTMTTPESEFEDNEEAKKQDKMGKYMARAIEIAFIVLKFNYDYCNYMSQRCTGAIYAMNYKVYKSFSKNCETFLFNRLMTVLVRSFLFLSSLFMRNIDEMSISVESFIKDFSNTIDAGVVLKWFEITKLENQEVRPDGCDEFSVMVFVFIRNLFFEQLKFKDKFYMSWRLQMFIKIFVNYFVSKDDYLCTELLKPIMNTDTKRRTSSVSGYEESSSVKSNPYQSESSDYLYSNSFDSNIAFDNQLNREVTDSVSTNIEDDKFMDEFLKSIGGDGFNPQPQQFDINQLVTSDPSKSMFDVMMEEQRIHRNFEGVNFFEDSIQNNSAFRDIVNTFGASPAPDSDLTARSVDPDFPSSGAFTNSSTGSIPTPGLFDAFNPV